MPPNRTKGTNQSTTEPVTDINASIAKLQEEINKLPEEAKAQLFMTLAAFLQPLMLIFAQQVSEKLDVQSMLEKASEDIKKYFDEQLSQFESRLANSAQTIVDKTERELNDLKKILPVKPVQNTTPAGPKVITCNYDSSMTEEEALAGAFFLASNLQ